MVYYNGIVLLAGLTASGPEAERIDGVYMMAGLDSNLVPRLVVLNADGTIGSGGATAPPTGGSAKQFLRGDNTWSNLITDNAVYTADTSIVGIEVVPTTNITGYLRITTVGGIPRFLGRSSQGTISVRIASALNSVLANFGGVGYDGVSAFASDLLGGGALVVRAAEAYTTLLQGTYLGFETVPIGGIATRTTYGRLDHRGFFVRSDGMYLFSTGALTGTLTPDAAIARQGVGVLEVNSSVAGTLRDLRVRDIISSDTAFLHKTIGTLADGAAAQLGTLATAPLAGNPTKWIPIDDNGTTRYIPAW